MIILNYLLSLITGWALGYVCVNSRTNKYEQWYGVFFYITMFLGMIVSEFVWEYSLFGLIVCTLTTYYTHIPKFENGYDKIV